VVFAQDCCPAPLDRWGDLTTLFNYSIFITIGQGGILLVLILNFVPCILYLVSWRNYTQYPILNTQYSILNTQYSILNTQYSIRNTQYAIRNTLWGLAFLKEKEYNIKRVSAAILEKKPLLQRYSQLFVALPRLRRGKFFLLAFYLIAEQ